MKILITGRYDQEYNRNLILINGLKAKGVSIAEAPYKRKKDFEPSIFQQMGEPFDLVFLPSFTHYDVRFIRKKLKLPVVFDPLISRYLTKVGDYKSVHPYSPRALKNFLKDRLSMQAADIVLADTEGHRQYFIDKLGISAEKIHVVPVGVDTNDFNPSDFQVDPSVGSKVSSTKKSIVHSGNKSSGESVKESGTFTVGFYGTYIPLHGIEKIIHAAVALQKFPDIKFQIIGSGPTEGEMKKLLAKVKPDNLELIPQVPYKELPGLISTFDISLGIFGDSLKAQLVIPNKIFHYCAMGKAVITRETRAIREIFTPGEDIITTDGSSSDLAAKILELKNKHELRETIAENGMKLIREKYNQNCIAEIFLDATKDIQMKR